MPRPALLRGTSETVVAHPGYHAAWGSSVYYANAPAPFFRVDYAPARKGDPTTRTFRFTTTLEDHRAR